MTLRRFQLVLGQVKNNKLSFINDFAQNETKFLAFFFVDIIHELSSLPHNTKLGY